MADAEKEVFFSYLPEDFKEYMDKELNLLFPKYCCGAVFWSREDDEPQRPSTLPDGDISDLNKLIRDYLSRIIYRWPSFPRLVQFWAPITTKEGRSFLTTRNQPFSLTYIPLDIGRLCQYRMISMDYKFDIDLGGETSEQHIGLPGRVFKHQFPESTPNVEFYSITEYPQRNDALRCEVKQSLAFPVFESSTQRCVGVIEVVTTKGTPGFLICDHYFQDEIYEEFEKLGLKCSVAVKHKDTKLDEEENEACTIALNEIKNVLKMVFNDHDLCLAQAWVPCSVCSPRRALVDDVFLRCLICHRYCGYDDFYYVNDLLHLKKGMGVVGRALVSSNIVFCRDVTQLSLTEYPLAHYARMAGLSGCFAICLQSSCTGNDVYVLEFFMPVSNETNENPHISLRKILETMRENFQTLRVASGEELWKELRIAEIPIQNGGELDIVQMPQTNIYLPWPEPLQSEVAVMQVDSSDRQLVNAINAGSNVGGTERNNIAITCTQEKSTVKSGVKIEISLEAIQQTSKMKLKDAAKKLKVSESTLKRSCRRYDIPRWHPHYIDKNKGKAPMDPAVKKSAPPSMLRLMIDSITDLQKQEQRKIKATQTTSREVRSKKRQEPSTTSMLQEDFNPKFNGWDIPLSQILQPLRHNSPNQTYQRKFSTYIEDEESPNSTPKEASQTLSNTQTHHPSEPSDPILNTLNNYLDSSPSINRGDVTCGAFPMEVLYSGTTEPINFPSVTSLDHRHSSTFKPNSSQTIQSPTMKGEMIDLDSSANGNPTSTDEIPTRSHCDISSPLNDQFNEPSQSKFQTNPGTETQVEGTPTNGPEPTNENNIDVRTEKMDNAPSSYKQVGEHTSTPMDDSPHGSNQTTRVKNMEENPSVNENTEDINPHATSEPHGISSSLQALEVPSTLISLGTPHVSMEKTTIGETATPITNPINPVSTVVQVASSSNTGSLSIWEEIEAFQKSVEHVFPLSKRLHHFNHEDQQIVSSFLNFINTSFGEIISKQSKETLNCLTAIQRLSPTPFSQNQLSHLAQIISEWPIIVETAQNCRNTIQAKKDFLMGVQTTSDSLITTCQASSNLSVQDRSLALEEAKLEAELALVRQKRHELQQEKDKLGHEAKILLSKTENNRPSIQAAKEELEQAQATFATTQSKWSILAHIFPRD